MNEIKMTERKENRSARRSRRLIREAFEQLLAEKEFTKITITDIMERADLSRTTFYVHYPDIFGIVEEMQNEILQKNMQIFSNIEYRNILKDPMPYLECISNILRESMDLYRKVGYPESGELKKARFQILMENDIINNSDIPAAVRNSPYFAIRVNFFLGGIMNVYQHWADGELSCSLEEVTDHIAHMIQHSAKEFLNTDWTRSL